MLYIGSKGTLYYRHENGRLTRFGVRVTEEGLKVFDPILHTWYDVPASLETTGGGTVTIQVSADE
jgi:hypothetical protein